MIRPRFACLAVWLFLFGAASVSAGPAAWTEQGPFGGTIRRIAVDPNVPSRLYASTSNGFFRSVDGGVSWQRAETGLLEQHPFNLQFTLDPNVANALWLADDTGRLYRSTDGATHWTPTGDVIPAMSYGTSSLAAAKSAPGVLYETVWGLGIRKSVDGGVSFTTLGGGLVGGEYASVAVDPSNPAVLLATTLTECQAGEPPSSLYRSTDGGNHWTAVVPTTGCVRNYNVVGGGQIAFGPAGSNRVYALSYYTLLRSDDGGASFAPTGLQASAIAVSPADADVLWLTGVNSLPYSLGYALEKSIDGGHSATTYATGLTTNGVFQPAATSIAIHPDYPTAGKLWLGTTNAGVYASVNDGASWSAHNDGLAAALIRALAVHPTDGSRLYAGYGDAFDPSPAFYRSTTAGGFVPSNSGLDAYSLRGIAIDPTTANPIGDTVIYGVGYGWDWDASGPTHQNSGIYKSSDNGLTWSTLSGGVPAVPYDPAGHFAGSLRVIALDPRSCATPPTNGPCASGPLQIAYVGGSGVGVDGEHLWRVMKTTDAGATWTSSETGLPADVDTPAGSDLLNGVATLVIDPQDTQTLYIGTFASAADSAGNPVSPTVASGVFKSTDGGAHWLHSSAGLPRYPGSTDTALDVLSLAIDPVNPQNLWASTVNITSNPGPGAIYKTTDGGAHWSLSNAGVTAPDTRALLVDPDDPSVIYAASAGIDPANPGGVYKSVDGGTTWNSMSVGLPSSSALALALDPVDSRILHAGTRGGVYTITQLPDDDHDGVPDLIENAGPNGGDADHDGTPDALQSNVSTTALGLLGNNAVWRQGEGDSVQAQVDHLHEVLNSGTVGGYFTVKIISGDCTHSVDVAPVDAGPHGRDRVAHHGTFDYPRGLLRFELPECSNAIVDVSFNAANFGSGWSWRYYGPSTPGDATTMGWHDASSLVSSHDATTWRLHLTAGQFGSYRSASANAILFMGGPADNDTVFNDGFDP